MYLLCARTVLGILHVLFHLIITTTLWHRVGPVAALGSAMFSTSPIFMPHHLGRKNTSSVLSLMSAGVGLANWRTRGHVEENWGSASDNQHPPKYWARPSWIFQLSPAKLLATQEYYCWSHQYVERQHLWSNLKKVGHWVYTWKITTIRAHRTFLMYQALCCFYIAFPLTTVLWHKHWILALFYRWWNRGAER